MTRFSATTESTAVVAAERDDIWRVLTDPALLAELTPLLRRIDADGDLWRWQMTGLDVLGVGISPAFTERMRWVPGHRIEFTHQPPRGVAEQAGAEGHYDLCDVPGGTLLSIRLQLDVELPLPRLAAPAVRTVMGATMRAMGDRFSANLLAHLDRAHQPVG
jgi:carbon monoxide dehydrogenase subunit G